MNSVEILLVEDNPHDAEQALYTLRKHNITRRVEVVQDGAEALNYVFHTGAYASSETTTPPKVVFLDLKLPKVDGLEVLQPPYGVGVPIKR
jgi:CheY-like chemotaxis protein